MLGIGNSIANRMRGKLLKGRRRLRVLSVFLSVAFTGVAVPSVIGNDVVAVYCCRAIFSLASTIVSY